MLASNLQSVSVLSDHLIRVFTFYQSLQDAKDAFFWVPKPTVFTWNAIISAHTKLTEGREVFSLFARMQQQGVVPNKVTFLLVLKACANLHALSYGQNIHQQIIILGFSLEVAVTNVLIYMYSRCGSLREAHHIFSEPESPCDVISWSSLISGYAQHGYGLAALNLYDMMQDEGWKPEKSVLSCVLNACGSIKAINQGRWIHDRICRDGITSDVVMEGALVNMYVKCGKINEARCIFDRLQGRDCIMWSTMILGYVQHALVSSALELFGKMQQSRIQPDRVTYLSVLKACSLVRAVKEGNLVHGMLIRQNLDMDIVLSNALVDMYGNCGNFEDAHKVFDELSSPDIVSWSTMISGYAERGEIALIEVSLKRMEHQGLKLDNIIFIGILSVCNHSGLLANGCIYFNYMMDCYRLPPSPEHYNSLVNLLGRTGHLEEARSLLLTMPTMPDIVGWTSFLTGCKTFNNMGLAGHSDFHASLLDSEEVTQVAET